MIARIITIVLLAIWAVLVLMGKGGFVHLLLVSAISVGMVEIMALYRASLDCSDANEP